MVEHLSTIMNINTALLNVVTDLSHNLKNIEIQLHIIAFFIPINLIHFTELICLLKLAYQDFFK